MPRVAPKPEEICEVFIDESSQTKNKYLVLGGVIFDGINRQKIFDGLLQTRLPELPHGEMKWAKVSTFKLAAYKRFVDHFWDSPLADNIHFHSLIVDTSRQDHRRFNQGSREIGFNKEVYQIASKFRRAYQGLFHVYLDERKTVHSTDDLRLILNRGAAAQGDKRDWPFRRCHFRNSKICPALQLTDLFIGAIGFHVNGHISAEGASPAKVELASHIIARAGIKNVAADTSIKGKFTVWHRKLK